MKAILRTIPVIPLVLTLTTACAERPTGPEAPATANPGLFKKGGNPGGGGAGNGTEPIALTGTDLGTLGGALVDVEGINADGWITGYATKDADRASRRPFVWIDGSGMQELPLPDRFVPMPGTEGYTSPVLINDHGTIAGAAPDPARDGHHQTPLVWTYEAPGGWIPAELPLPELPGMAEAGSVIPRAMNDAGQIVFMVMDACMCDDQPAVWTPADGSWTALTEPAGALWTRAVDINDQGVIVGYSRLDGSVYEAYVWHLPSTDPVALPIYDSSVNQRTGAITDGGVIVGYAMDSRNKGVVVRWTPLPGGGYDVARVEALGDGFAPQDSGDINSCGQIVADDKALSSEGTVYQLESLYRRGDIWGTRISDGGWIVGTSAAPVKGPGAATDTRGTLWTLPGGC
jgi:hypothetical protein